MSRIVSLVLNFAVNAIEAHPDIAKVLLIRIASLFESHAASTLPADQATAALNAGIAAAAASACTDLAKKLADQPIAR